MKTSPRPVSIIAEFCQNHNGDYDLLARMVESAAQNGATHGKVQTIYASDVTFRPEFEEGLIIDGIVKAIKRPYKSEIDRLSGLELSEMELEQFIRLCNDNGLVPMTTCFTRAHVKPMAELGFREIKVASYDCASHVLLRELAALFPRLIVSTGATFDDEIEHTASILKGRDFAFLHCVTIYPTPLEEMHMGRMSYLSELAPEVGFSDHSLVADHGVLAAKAAVFLGASIVERHFTILPPDQTRDGPVSMTPQLLNELAGFIHLSPEEQEQELDSADPNWRRMVGKLQRKLSHTELLNRAYYRGRFASRRPESVSGMNMIYNWEETPIK